jgi:shikimate dehydrogenase
MNITGKAKVYGLLGHPVEHSMSPVLHHTLSDILGHEIAYVPFDVKRDLDSAVKGAYELNIQGMNVTVPYKQEVMSYLSEVDPLAKKIGAVNTLVRCEDGYKGYNTDMPGLKRAMENDGVRIKDGEFYLIGAGGVARAVLLMLLENGAKQVHILNRSVDKAEQLAESLKDGYETKVTYGNLQSYHEVAMLGATAIQATNLGMYPNTDVAVIEDEEFYKTIRVAYDLIFNPVVTKFMVLAQKQEKRAFNGLKMLLFQGIIAYEYWHQVSVSDEMANKVYDAMLEELLKQ